jgi:hypothetical protein
MPIGVMGDGLTYEYVLATDGAFLPDGTFVPPS